ncbi:retrovirus-related pol polyprotein from transposon TNT 1-94, partial [Tanacetum coccineum]
ICLGVDLEPDEWNKDIGCSKHMMGNQKLFSTYKAYNGGNVIFGSNLRCNIIGKGTISNDSLKIDNVEHVDNLGFNLLSIGQICDNKCKVTFSEHDSEINKNGKVIGRGIRKKGLYVMKLGNKPTEEPVDSLIMEDKHLDTISATESDEVIKSSIEDLVHTPSESDGISESESYLPVCDDSSLKKDQVLDDIISISPGNGNDYFNAESSLIESVLNRDNVISSPKIDFLLEEFASELALIAPIPPGIVEADFDPKGDIRFIENLMYDNSFPRPPETLKDDSETVIDSNNDYSSSDNDSLYSDDVDYVEASPPDSELVSLEVIKALKDNSTPSFGFVTKSSSTSLKFFLEEIDISYNSLPESETFCFNLEKKSSGNPTSYSDLSLPDYEAFFCDSKPDSGNFTMDVVEDISDNPTRELYIHVLHDLPTHPSLQLEFKFSLFKFLSPNEFSFYPIIRDPLSSIVCYLAPIFLENEDNVFNPGILASNEEKSPHLLSHRGFKAFQLISESPMMISRGDIPILDVSIARIMKTRACGFCPRSTRIFTISLLSCSWFCPSFTRASNPQLHYGNPIS